jgi:cell shape-determining protein MreD
MTARSVAVVLIGFSLLLVQSTLYHLIPWGAATPNLVLPLLLAMGISDTPPAWGAPIAFAIGYLGDVFSGSPMGLQTIVAVGTFLFGHFASVRLFIEGIPFQVVLTLAASLLSSATILGLRWVFERGWEGPSVAWVDLLVRAGVTAVAAPLVFSLATRVVPRRPRAEEAAA